MSRFNCGSRRGEIYLHNSTLYLSETQALAINALAFSVRGIRGGIPPRHIKGVLECVVDIVISHTKMTDLPFQEVVKESVRFGFYMGALD
jgi:hypothetical protein